jgi:hypothetical protein
MFSSPPGGVVTITKAVRRNCEHSGVSRSRGLQCVDLSEEESSKELRYSG